ncbi:hypothetical protein Gotur_014327 [Gossypium turneri]
MLSALESRVVNLEESMGDMRGTRVRDDAFEAMVMTLKEETKVRMRVLSPSIEELKEELVVSQAAVGKRVLSTTLNNEIDVLKLKNFKEQGPQDYFLMWDYLEQSKLFAVTKEEKVESDESEALNLRSMLAKDVLCNENIDLKYCSAKETVLEMLRVQQIDTEPIELSIGVLPMREMGYSLKFMGKEVMHTKQLNKVNAE